MMMTVMIVCAVNESRSGAVEGIVGGGGGGERRCDVMVLCTV